MSPLKDQGNYDGASLGVGPSGHVAKHVEKDSLSQKKQKKQKAQVDLNSRVHVAANKEVQEVGLKFCNPISSTSASSSSEAIAESIGDCLNSKFGAQLGVLEKENGVEVATTSK